MDNNDEALRLNLDILDEKREQVLRCTEDYQRKTTRYYNQKVKPRSYMPGDLRHLQKARGPLWARLGPMGFSPVEDREAQAR